MKKNDFHEVFLSNDEAISCLLSGKDISKVYLIDGIEADLYNRATRLNNRKSFLSSVSPFENVSRETFHENKQNTWKIPDKYLQVNIEEVLYSLCKTDIERHRVEDEIALYKEKNLLIILKLVLYLVENTKEIIGVGRGSSVSSYCLFLLGLHRVDSIKYELDIKDFLR